MATRDFPPIRACIFDVDGLLINTEDIYTGNYNKVLYSYNCPNLPWEIKALQQSRGTKGTQRVLDWANLTIPISEWSLKTAALHSSFRNCVTLPGVVKFLNTLSHYTNPEIKIALASSSGRKLFDLKTAHLPSISSAFPETCRVFGDDPDMGDAKKKPMPDIFLLALDRINTLCAESIEEKVKPEECLVFEDSIAGVEAGRRAGMRVIWVPHEGLAEVCKGREIEVLEGRTEEDGMAMNLYKKMEVASIDANEPVRTRDGCAQRLPSLEGFPYDEYGICVFEERE